MALDGALAGLVTSMAAFEGQGKGRTPLVRHETGDEADHSAHRAHASGLKSAIARQIACAVIVGAGHARPSALWRMVVSWLRVVR